MNEETISKELAEIIREAKEKSGQTISSIAELMHRNDKTISNWISGKAAPTVPALFVLFDVLDQPIFKQLIKLKYPNMTNENDATDKKHILLEYLEKNATNDEIEKLYYIIFADHGSSWFYQLEEFTALDHLPMRDRLLIAYIIANTYELSKEKGELTNNETLPDMSTIWDSIDKGKQATINGLNYYK